MGIKWVQKNAYFEALPPTRSVSKPYQKTTMQKLPIKEKDLCEALKKGGYSTAKGGVLDSKKFFKPLFFKASEGVKKVKTIKYI